MSFVFETFNWVPCESNAPVIEKTINILIVNEIFELHAILLYCKLT